MEPKPINEKFFDLDKGKQDRIINSSLKIFTENGYRHASTDEIVQEASISKGLLFHYFISKAGLYTFLYDYSTKYVLLELRSSTGNIDETDYFKVQNCILHSMALVTHKYPYMLLFLSRAFNDETPEAADLIRPYKGQISSKYDEMEELAAHPAKLGSEDTQRLTEMIRFTALGLLRKRVQEPDFDASRLENEILGYIDTIYELTLTEPIDRHEYQ